jgi:RecA-family ATPase
MIHNLMTWAELEEEYASFTWQWHGWLPNGVVTMLAADPGIGKSMFALSVADKMLRGGAWFDGVREHEAKGDTMTLWVECESGEPFHLIRAGKLGADTSRFVTMRALDESARTPALTNVTDRERFRSIMQNPDVCLAVIDSLSGAITGIDENSAEVGKVVQWVSEVARDTGKPVLLIHHMNKSTMRTRNADTPPSMADLRGSTSIAQHCRVIWAMDTPYGDDAKLRLSCIKNNLAPKPHPVTLLIHPDGYVVGSGDIMRPVQRDFSAAF